MVAERVVSVVQTEDGVQATLAPKECETKYGWQNDPDKVNLLPDPLKADPPASKPTAADGRKALQTVFKLGGLVHMTRW